MIQHPPPGDPQATFPGNRRGGGLGMCTPTQSADHPGGAPGMSGNGTVAVAACEKNRCSYPGLRERVCALEGCEDTFVPRRGRGRSAQRYCTERCRRIAERRRYRERRTEQATCAREGCDNLFERSTTSERTRIYCTLECQYAQRSESYRNRPDIIATLRRTGRPGGGAPRSVSLRTADVASGARQGSQIGKPLTPQPLSEAEV